MTRNIIGGIGILTTGAVAGALLFSSFSQTESQPATINMTQSTTAAGSEPVIDTSAGELGKHVEALEEELNHYRDWAYQLENQVIELESRLELLEEIATTTDQNSGVAPGTETSAKESTDTPENPSGILSVAALVNNGIDPQLAAKIVKQKNSHDMQQLEMRDRAIRDGTFGEQAYFDALRELNDAGPVVRSEIGDDDYDRYLYTLGQPNRVVVTSVIPGSPAEQAGVQDGDVILDYGDNRIFSWSELRDATTEGELGDYIQVNLLRNGGQISLLLPRGPLGVRMGSKLLNPSSN